MAKTRKKIECLLPTYQKDRAEWRKAILANVLEATDGVSYAPDEELEVVVLLYLQEGKRLAIHDVDNRLKDILDALQGMFKSSKVAPDEARIIHNDNQVCRVLIEKQKIPKKISPDSPDAGGRILIRPYNAHRWPLQSDKSNQKLRKS